MAQGTTLHRIGLAKEPALCDVVFVHGLMGDPHSTWQNKNNLKGDYWPGWLAETFPETAVWSVGYDAAVSDWFGRAMPIAERAKNLLARLAPRGIGERPLAFITHSMGGLVVKQMMRSAELAEQYKQFQLNTKLVVFVSVPHAGAGLAAYLSALAKIYGVSAAIQDFQADDAQLLELSAWFRLYVTQKRLKVVSFHEEVRTKGVWVVKRASADFGDPGHVSIGETLDHIEICKPQLRDAIIVENTETAIKELVRDVKNKVVPEDKSILRFDRIAHVDDQCVGSILESPEHCSIAFHKSIQKAIATLRSRDEDFGPFFHSRARAAVLTWTDRKEREKFASDIHLFNNEILQKTVKTIAMKEEALGVLLRQIGALNSPSELSLKAIQTFGAFSALQVIQVLKDGFDLEENGGRFWFEEFKFDNDCSGSLFELVPQQSNTGRLVFGYRVWVIARVGHERLYEYVTVPLKIILPIFRDGTKGDRNLFYSWVLPQLVLWPRGDGIESFPIEDWEAFVLRGANGIEWWDRYLPCPWPEQVNSLDMIEL